MAGVGDHWGTREEFLHPRDAHGRFRRTWRMAENVIEKISGFLSGFRPKMFGSDAHAGQYAFNHAPPGRFAHRPGRGPSTVRIPRGEGRLPLDARTDTIDGFHETQAALRSGKMDPSTREFVARFDRLRSPTEDDLIVSRRVNPEAFGLTAQTMHGVPGTGEGGIEDLTGKEIHDAGYFPANLGTPVGQSPVLMTVAVPKGTQAVFPGNGQTDREVILDRGQHLRVTKVTPDGRGGYYVAAVVTPHEGGETPKAVRVEAPPAPGGPRSTAAPEILQQRTTPEQARSSMPIPGAVRPGQQPAPRTERVVSPATGGTTPSGAPPARVPEGALEVLKSRDMSTDPEIRTIQIENRIREAYRRVMEDRSGKGFEGFISLAELRDKLGEDLSRKEIDATLRRLARTNEDSPGGRVRLIPVANTKALSRTDHEAALPMGEGDNAHAISFSDPSPRPVPGSKAQRPTTRIGVPESRTELSNDVVRRLNDPKTTIAQLREIAKEHNVKIPSSVTRKANIRDHILGKPGVPAPAPAKATEKLPEVAPSRKLSPDVVDQLNDPKITVAKMKEIAREHGIKIPSSVTRKADIKDHLLGRSGPSSEPSSGSRTRLSYLDAENSLLLDEYAATLGLNIHRLMDPTRQQMRPTGAPLEEQRPFGFQFEHITDGLKSGSVNQETAIKELRNIPSIVNRELERAREYIARAGREHALPYYLAVERDAPLAIEAATKLADALETLKLPRRKRQPTIGALETGEIPNIDEARFATPEGDRLSRPSPKGGLVLHRGQAVPESFKHPTSGMMVNSEEKPPLRPGLTPEENQALDLYVSSAIADPLNAALRGNTEPPTVDVTTIGERQPVDLRDIQRHLDEAIASSELSRDTTLWRGTLLRPADRQSLQPGAIITEPGYLSTAVDERLAWNIIGWRKRNAPAYRKPVLFRILTERGTHAAVGHEAAGEIVLGRGSRIQILRTEDEKWSGTTIVTALLVDGSESRKPAVVMEGDSSPRPSEAVLETASLELTPEQRDAFKAAWIDAKIQAPQGSSRRELNEVYLGVRSGRLTPAEGIRQLDSGIEIDQHELADMEKTLKRPNLSPADRKALEQRIKEQHQSIEAKIKASKLLQSHFGGEKRMPRVLAQQRRRPDDPAPGIGPVLEKATSRQLTPLELAQGESLTPAGRKQLDSLGPHGHPGIADIKDPENKIRAGVKLLRREPYEPDTFVSFEQLRKIVGDQLSKEEFDNAIRRLVPQSGVHIVPQSYGRENAATRIPASVKIGGQENDHIAIEPPGWRKYKDIIDDINQDRTGGQLDEAEAIERLRAERAKIPAIEDSVGRELIDAEIRRLQSPDLEGGVRSPKSTKGQHPVSETGTPDQRDKFRDAIRKLGLNRPGGTEGAKGRPFGDGPRRQWQDAYRDILAGDKSPEEILRQLETDIAENEAELKAHKARGIEPHLQQRTVQQLPNDINKMRDLVQLIRKTFDIKEGPRHMEPGSSAQGGKTAGPLQVRDSLTKATDTDSLARIAQGELKKITGRDIAVDLGPDADLITSQEHMEGILRVVEQWPDANLREVRWFKGSIGPISSTDQRRWPWAVGGNGTIMFNSAYTSPAGRARYLEELAAGTAGWTRSDGSGFHPRNADTPAIVSIHEFGHILDEGGLIHLKTHGLVKRRAEAARVHPSKLVRRQISDYASRGDLAELIAEAFLDVSINGDEASQLSKDIVALLRAEYARAKGTS